MNLKKTLILALVALGLGAYIFYSEMPRIEEKKNQGMILGGIKSDQIEKVEIVKKDESLTLVRDSSDKKTPRWTLDSASGPDLDIGAVNSLLVSLADAKGDSSIPKEEVESDLSVYGLKDPVIKLNITSNGGTNEIALGKLSEYSHKRYAKVSGKDELFLITDSIHAAASKSKSDFREKTPIKFADADLASFSVNSPTAKITLVQNEGKWRVTEPVAADANDPQVSEVLRNLRYLRAERFYNPAVTESDELGKKAQKEKYGLEKPEITYLLNFKAESKRSPLTVVIGKGIETGVAQTRDEDDDGESGASSPVKAYFFKIEGRDEVYGLSDQPAKSLSPAVYDLREKELFKFATDSFASAEVTGKGLTPVKIIKEIGKDNTATWKVNDKPGDGVFIEDYIEDLTLTAAQSFPDVSADFGFTDPQLKISVKISASEGKEPSEQTLVVGSKLAEKKDGKALYYAGVNDLSEPFTINEDTLKQITPKVESLLPVPPQAASPTASPAA